MSRPLLDIEFNGRLSPAQAAIFIRYMNAFPVINGVWKTFVCGKGWRTLGRTEVKGWRQGAGAANPERGNKYERAD